MSIEQKLTEAQAAISNWSTKASGKITATKGPLDAFTGAKDYLIYFKETNKALGIESVKAVSACRVATSNAELTAYKADTSNRSDIYDSSTGNFHRWSNNAWTDLGLAAVSTAVLPNYLYRDSISGDFWYKSPDNKFFRLIVKTV